MAILLCGLHYYTNYNHDRWEPRTIDFREYVKNIKTRIYDFFKCEMDTFIVTNRSEKLEELLKTYNPKDYEANVSLPQHIQKSEIFLKKLRVLKLLMDYIEKTKEHYDVVLMTRFDIYFIKELVNIDFNKLNIVSVLESNDSCDDNLLIFPIKYLSLIFELITNNSEKHAPLVLHLMKNIYERHIPVNYIQNEYVEVRFLSFYKLPFFDNIHLIMNKYLFTENVKYKSAGTLTTVTLYDDIIEFNKRHNGAFSWIGYELNGKYNLSFEIYTDKIIDFDFIKYHNPVGFYKTPTIQPNEWVKIELNIELSHDLVCFIFDDYNDEINIKYKNMSFTHVE